MRRTCPYHGAIQPCRQCLLERMGEFAHTRGYNSKILYVPPHRREKYIPPHLRIIPVHVHQKSSEDCAIACCAMVSATLNRTRKYSYNSILRYMVTAGIYRRGNKSAPVFDRPLEYLGLSCEMRIRQSIENVRDIVINDEVVILETVGHVIVIFGVNSDGSLIIGDPSMYNIENDVVITDYRLKQVHPERVWIARRKK